MTHAPSHDDNDRLRRAHERDPATIRLLRAFADACGFTDLCPHRACRRAKACAWRFPSCYARDEAGFKTVLHPFIAAFGLSGTRLPVSEEDAARLSDELSAGLSVLRAARLEGLFVLPQTGGDPAALPPLMRDVHILALECVAQHGSTTPAG